MYVRECECDMSRYVIVNECEHVWVRAVYKRPLRWLCPGEDKRVCPLGGLTWGFLTPWGPMEAGA